MREGLKPAKRQSIYARLYRDLSDTAVRVLERRNEIEWRVEGLAVIMAMFVLGAAGIAPTEGTQVDNPVGNILICRAGYWSIGCGFWPEGLASDRV